MIQLVVSTAKARALLRAQPPQAVPIIVYEAWKLTRGKRMSIYHVRAAINKVQEILDECPTVGKLKLKPRG